MCLKLDGRRAFTDHEQWGIRVFAILSWGQISPESISGGFAEIHCPSFSTFGAAFSSVADLQFPTLGIKITDTESAEF
jgi:hypothetical protein